MDNNDDRRVFNLLTARWLALGAAAGVALSLGLDQFNVQGPWQGIALALALLQAAPPVVESVRYSWGRLSALAWAGSASR